ncbi:MAG TPA: LamG-like jellyroll fold domain-containing protein [Opitutaceae bacterium]|nr:LamG-like jellyroll fold domain-containing protein [Opitutaceae bacterium]
MNSHVLFSRWGVACAVLGLAAASARGALIHRYSFEGGAVKDSVGRVDGALRGAGASVADGKLVLRNEAAATGDKISHVAFAGSILPAGGRSVSLVVWFTAKEVGDFARVLNFGASEGTEGVQFIYFSPHVADGTSRAAITGSDVGSKTFLDFDPTDDGKPHMVAIVIDGAAKKLRVFVDGREPKPAENLGDNTLDRVKPVENWLGKSSFAADPGFSGTIDELRIYDQALTPEEATALAKAGPDALPGAGMDAQKK